MYFNRKNAEQKNWRMIKKGKHFLFGCSLVFAVGATLVTPTVHADNVEAKAEVTAGATQAEQNAEAPTYEAPAATSSVVTGPAETAPVEANSAITAVSVDKSQLELVLAQAKAKNLDGQEASVKAEVTAAIAEAEALVANGTASQEQVNQSVERLNQAVASVKEVTEATVETTTEAASEETTDSSETPKVRNKRATTEGTTRSVDETKLDRVTVTKDNFDSFFKEGGTTSYDETSGTIKLTDDVSGQVGSAYLRFKIDPNEDFTFTGKVDIGNKYEGHKVNNRAGGDGVGFVFHTGNVDKLGQSGASIGMGGIPAAFGFKLDSWHNTSNPNADQKAIADPKNFSGWNNSAFGAFYSSNNAGKVDTIKDAKALNPAPNGDWVDFKINYSGSKKEFTVTYGTQTWTTKIAKNSSSMSVDSRNSLSDRNATYALSFLGSTGSGTNLQRVQIEKFEFTAPQIVQVAFYDESGKEIAASSAIPGNRDEVINLNSVEAVQKAISKLDAKGYTLKEVNSEKAETYNAGANTVRLRSGGQLLKYVFKVKDTTPPAAPTVNSVTAGATAVTGTAEAGSTVEVTLPGGAKKSATAGEDGTFSIPVSGLNENDEVSVTATDAANNTSAPTTATVAKADDKTAPEAPSVNPVKAGDEAITGKAEPGSTVEVTLPGGAKKSATAGEDGSFSIPVSGLNENDEVTVTATDAANNTSAPTTATVAKADDKTAPEAPSVNPVKAGDEAITGKAEPGSTVEVTLPGGAKKSATAGEDGSFSIPVSGLNENDEVTVTATDAANNTSAPTTATVAKADDKTAPEAPSVNPVKAGDEAITGKAEPGSTVEVTLPGGAKKSATAGEDGTFSIPVSGLNENDEVTVTATDAANNTSAPTTATVAKADDKTAPEAPSVNPVKAGDEAITGKAEPGSTVEVTLPGGAKKSATAGEDGSFSIPVSGLNENDEVTVTATDAANNTSAPTTATVAKADDKTAPEAPSVNPVKAGDEAITGKAEPGSTVEVTLPGGAKKSATAGEDGSFSIPVSGLNENDEVTVTATDASNNTSAPTTATVAKADDKTAPEAPSVNPVKAGDEAITGKAEPGSTVEVTLPGGAKKSATAGEDGSFSIPVSGLNENDEVTVTATDAANNTSAPTTATVAKADDKTAPEAPSVNPVKAGDEAITGKAEPGSTVEVTLPGGAKKSATAGEDGSFSIPVSGLNENDEVTVTATDAANNTSAPTTATVAKADDKTAPEAPSVNPVKAGDEAITGKAEPGSTVEVTLPGGAKKSATAGEDGSFSIPVSGLNENDEVTVTATDAANNTSAPTTATVAKADDKTAPEAPSVNPVKAGDEAITGKAEPGSTVEVTLPGGAKKSATAGEDGSFSIPVSGLNENDEVSVTATDAANNTSAPTTATVGKAADKTAPEAPSVNPVKAGDEAITGKAEPGSTVEVTLPGGAKKSATAGEDGTFSIPVSGLNENDEVSVTATDAANNTSAPTTATVGKAADKTAPEAPSVNPVKAGDEAITGKAEPGSTVEVTLPGGAKKSATAGEDGTFSIPVSGLNENDEVSVTATDAANNTSAPTTATVGKAADKTAPEAPSVNPVKAGDEAITGKAEPGSTVEVTLPGGAKKSATAGEDGTFSIPVSGLNENDEVSVTATDAANNTSAPTTATVGKAADKTAPEAPSVNPVKAGDEAITGKAEPGSTVEVTLPGGAKKSATAGEDGTFSIPVSGLNENDEVSVTATDAANNTSAPTTATVGKAADKTAPEAPSVNPVKAGDEAITGKAEPGSTVEVTLPGGAKKSATAGEDGTFSIPVSGLNENDEVSVTATDAANNTSAPTTATVGKAADKTAPEAPSVNPVKAGDEAITGKAEPGSTVEVTLPGGAKKSATAGEDGTFSIPVSGLNENDEVSVTATDAANNTSAPTTATVGKAADKTAPEAPSVNPVKAGDEAITGKAEPGSTVEVTLPGGAKKSATAGEDGTFSIPVSGLNENDEVSVTATDAANNTSAPTTATVGKAADKTAPEAPSVNPVKAGDEAITGKAEPGSTVEVTLPGGAKKSATAGEDGTFSIPVSGLNENDEVSVTATDAANNTSAPTTATVGKAADKTAPEAPSVNPVKAGDEAITGKAEPGSTVEVTLPGGAKKSATAGEDGTFSIPVSGLNENDEVSVTATDAANNTSAPTTATVGKAADKTAPEAPSVNPVKAGDEAITGKAEPGSTVEVTLPGGAKKSATAGEDGTFSIPVSGLNENDEVSVTATDAANNTSAPTTATVGKAADKTAPEAPSVNPVKAGDEAITGKAEPGSTVEVTLPGGAKKSATAGEDGTFSIPVSGLNENDEVSVTATDAANNTSAPTTATVGKAADKTAPEAPSVNPVKAGDEAITGKAEPGSTVEVTLPGGAKKSATAGEDGTFSIPVSGLNENDEVSVTATDAANNTSAPTTATVGKAADKTAPEAPSVNPVKAGDEAITGKAEPGSTVEVTLPGGAKKSATAGEDGSFSIPVAGLNENDEVTVTATDAAKNTSAPTTATVGKADDKTAPAAPSVNPVKAGDEAITGKAEPGSTVEVTLPGGAKKSATAGEDGSFRIPVSGLNENDEVTVTATDAAKNTSAPTTATVGKADDKTAPAAPSVNPVKAGDEAITGKAEPGSTVEVTLPGGAKKSATAGEDGSFRIPVAGLNENDEVTVTATDAAKNTSAPTTATVGKADDKTAPAAPSVNPVKAGDEAITGKAEPGSTVEVTLPGGAKKSATAGEDGSFSIPVSGLNENDEVTVTATDAANNTSAPTTATVGKADDKTAPEAPSVNPVKAGDEAITGKAEPGSTVEVTLPGGAKKSATAGEDGSFRIPVSGLNENDEVTVTATDAAKNTSAPTTATVGKADDKTAPAAPSVNPVKAGDEAITGKAEPGSTVEVTLPGGAKKSATAGEDGSFSIPVAGLNENDEVTVTATDAAKNTSAPTTATVGKADDKTAPAAPSVNPVKAGDEAITGKAEPGSTVEVTLPGGAKKSATAGEDGTFSIPVSGLNENDEVSVTATDAANNTSAPTTATVGKADDKTAPAAPSVNPVKAGDEAITGKAEPGSTVEVTLPGGAKKSATAGEDGTFSIPVAGLNENDEVTVTATDAAKNTSAPTTATVGKADDKTAPAAPSVNPVKAGDEAITGKAEPGSTVEVTLPGGAKKSATAGEDGSFSIPVSGLNENDEVSVTATDAANNTSAPTTATVGKAADKTAPEAPSVNPVKAGDEAITGKAEPGSTVEVTLPGGAKKSATAGEDGGFSIPVSGLNENDEVSVTATDAANNTSAPTTATVGKADANGAKAPEAKTPVKDPANLTEEEKIQVAEEILKANPTLADVDVANDGTATVTFPDGSKATLTPAQTVVKAEEKAKDADGLKAPETKTPVKDTANLTDDEKAAVKKAVEAANPGSVAEVGQDGTTKVTFPDGSTATLSGDKTVKAADANGLKEPAAKTPVKDTANLTDAEKAAVKKAVEAANPGSKAEVGQDGTTKVTFPDGSTATLTGDQTVKTADSNGVQAPSTKTPVKDTANLTDAEKAKVKEAVEAANPGSKAEVGQDGTTTVTFPDGSTATLTGDQTVKTADSNGIQAPSSKTPVKDTANLTDAEKAKVKEAVEAANPGSKAEVGQDGTTKVTFPDGSTATLTGDQTVKTADSNGVQAPSTKTPVKDTANLTDVEKAKVKEAVEAANPGSKAEVGQDGSTKVTFPDGSTATLTGDKTVTKADITAPTAPVVNPVKAGDTAVTGTAEAGSTVEVILPDGSKVSAKADKDGKFSVPVSGLHAGDTVSVTATDESGNTSATTTVTVSNVNVGGKDADNAKVPVLTPVVDPNNLTDAEKAKVAEEVKKANPTATDVKVNNDGSVVVTFADGSVATIAANKVVKEATKESSAQAPAKKAGAKELPNTGTKQSNASLGLALLAAVTGGLLISKKRKEEE